ncbi:transporter-like protein [Paramyrothecium foliicola]|nr:transporter-like protein [Paramyrothecium foliicola]
MPAKLMPDARVYERPHAAALHHLPSFSTIATLGKAESNRYDLEQSLPQAIISPDSTLKGWFTALGAFAAVTATLGVGNAVGLLLSYLEEHQLSTFAARDIGWIAATNIWLTLSIPVLAGPIFDRYGPRYLLLCGSGSFSVGLLQVSFLDGRSRPSVTFGLLMLAWGVLCGGGSGMISTAVTGVMCHWFDRRRGLACGLVFMGSSIGGVVWPLLLREALGRWGWCWALRVVGAIATLLLVMANVLVKGMLPGTRGRPMISRKCFQQADFMWMTMSLAMFQFVVMGVVSTLPSWGAARGFDQFAMFNIVAMMNGGSAVGRVAAGALSDWMGRFNAVLLVEVFSLFVVFGLFLNVGTSTLKLYVFSPCWGLGTGAVLSMMSVLIGECVTLAYSDMTVQANNRGRVCKKEEMGIYYGTNSFITSIAGLLSVPLSAQILEAYGTTAHILFFGGLCVVSTLLLTISRWAFQGHRWRLFVKV